MLFTVPLAAEAVGLVPVLSSPETVLVEHYRLHLPIGLLYLETSTLHNGS